MLMRYVYLIRAGKNHYKVGVASSVLSRVKSHQTSNGHLIEVVAAKQTPDASAYEQVIHKQLQSMKLQGGREWFELTPEQAIELSILINKSPSIDLSEVQVLQELLEEHLQKQKKISGRLEAIIEQMRAERVMPVKKSVIEQTKKIHKSNRDQEKKQADAKLTSEIIEMIRIEKKASTSLIQRRFGIGYGRASRIIDNLERHGVVGPGLDNKPREVLIPEGENITQQLVDSLS